MGDGRNDRLQSLRGLAALCVLAGHSALMLDTTASRMAGAVFQPNAAVILFFVLSGYVLTLSLERDGDLRRFAIRRAFRILPVYWIGVLVGCLSYLIADHPSIEGATQWFNGTIVGSANAVQWANIWPNLVVWTTSMSGVLWSVQVEIFAAPLIPLMWHVSRRVPLAVDLVIIVGLAILMKRLRESLNTGEMSQLFFLAYLLCFYLGVSVQKLLAIKSARSIVSSGRLMLIILALFLYVHIRAWQFGLDFWGYLVLSAFVSAWIVAYVAARERKDFLAWRPLIWLGDVSYSFYAYGTPIMMGVGLATLLALPASWRVTNMGSALIIAVTFGLSLAITLPLAALSSRLVEKNGNAIGRRVADLFSRPSEQQAVGLADAQT
jgi:peptidoglycan/LPS O-acetylase OafA/YrhL